MGVVCPDYCQILLPGKRNKQNCLVWGSERLQQVYKVPHSSPSAMTWYTSSRKEVTGPHFWENETYGTELQKHALMLCVFTTSNLYEEHDILTRWCCLSMCRCCTIVLRVKASTPLDTESSPDSLASTLAWFDFV